MWRIHFFPESEMMGRKEPQVFRQDSEVLCHVSGTEKC